MGHYPRNIRWFFITFQMLFIHKTKTSKENDGLRRTKNNREHIHNSYKRASPKERYKHNGLLPREKILGNSVRP